MAENVSSCLFIGGEDASEFLISRGLLSKSIHSIPQISSTKLDGSIRMYCEKVLLNFCTWFQKDTCLIVITVLQQLLTMVIIIIFLHFVPCVGWLYPSIVWHLCTWDCKLFWDSNHLLLCFVQHLVKRGMGFQTLLLYNNNLNNCLDIVACCCFFCYSWLFVER